MDCQYTYINKKGEQINVDNVIGLSKLFYKSTRQLSDKSAIYSSEEVQKSTVDILNGLHKYRTQIDANPNIIAVSEFITSTSVTPILKSIGVESERLAPEYIEENRITEFIKNELKNPDSSFDPNNIPLVNQEMLVKMKSKFGSVDENELKFYLSKIESIIAHEEKTKEFGTLMHKLIAVANEDSDGTNSGKYQSLLNEAIKNNPEIFGKGLEKEWKSKINKIVQDILTLVLNRGTPITELTLVSDPFDKAQVSGRLDLVVVDNKGTAHIYDIKVSKNSYDKWDDVKLLTLDWQLALYRQLLSKHIDVSQTELHVIPIQLETLGDPTSLFYTGSQDRKNKSRSGLIEGGALTVTARLLIPNKIFIKYDEEKLEKFVNVDLPGILPNYSIKTSKEEYDVDKIVEKVRRKGEWSYFNKFSENPDYKEKYIKADTEEEFREKIEKYVAYAKSQQHINVIRLKDAINSVINDPTKNAIEMSNKNLEIVANSMFKDYLNSGWEVLNLNEATALGLILFRNKNSGTIDVVSMTAYNVLADYSDVEGLSYGDLEHIKTFLFLNEFKEELFIGKGSKIGNVITFNPENGSTHYRTPEDGLELFINRMTATGRVADIKLNKNIHLLDPAKVAIHTVVNSLNSYQGNRKNELEQIFHGISGTDLNNVDLLKLLEVRKSMLKTFPEFVDKQFDPKLNFSDPVEYLFALLQLAILKKQGVDLSGDFIGMTKFALQWGDFKSLISALYTKDISEYDKNENKISGIMGGLMQVTPDFVRSNDLRNINLIIANVNSKIGQKMVEQSEKIHELTEKYWSDINFGGINRSIVGETQSKFENFFISEGGKVSKEFKVKNPYKNDVENALTNNESEYLKGILFEIQKYMLNLSTEEISKIDPKSLESLMKNEKIAKAMASGEYFKIPLVRREELSRHKGIVSGGLHGFWERFKGRLHEVNDFIDPRELDPEDLKNIKDSAVGFTEMYDVYGSQNDLYKQKVLDKHGVDYFEFNLDTIAHRVAFNKIRKYQFDSKLPIISAYVWWLKLHGGKQNKELDKVMEYIQNQMKLAAFDEPIVDDEFKTVATVTAAVKQITTAGMLAFRPILLLKELSIGVMKGVGLAASQIYGKDQFGLKDLTAAYGKLMTIDHKFDNEFNLIDKMNQYYRFANMDVNTIAKKMQTDRRGLMRGLGRWMYSMNTIPDYYNRLSLFLAKMIHDGSYDAHSIVDGKFVYDVTKDKRFEHYLKNREKYKNSKGEYVPATNDQEYNKQRNLYILLVDQLNKELGTDEKAYTEEDLVTKAYSEKERNSFKSFTDMAYGYYDKDSQSQLNNTWYGMIWMQFMQFWPGKMRQWVGKPIKGEDSPIGAFKQKTKIDENGVEQLVWRKAIYDEENPDIIKGFDDTFENTGDPMMIWEGTPQEGFIYSILYTAQDVFKGLKSGDFSDLKSDEMRLRRVGYALHDAVLMLLVAGLFKAFFDWMIEENGTDGIDGELLKFGQALNKKVLNETNIFQNTIGAIHLDPISVTYGQKVMKDLVSVMNGNKTVQQMIGRDIGAFEFLKDIN